ncbi:MAG: hypothetical protein JWL90_1227 [Chthoniobacteraceae bacterium]|nr:hypothetical protein [Chthoniobacteraceae bacterium]
MKQPMSVMAAGDLYYNILTASMMQKTKVRGIACANG